ncbi:dynein regulatory complex subunit 6 isoform X2 [Myripristis murdjan]|uniref:dynein regulatory complex subunit 6 isoform X2 n=1 Tax=Myripristis murdjan TaxID=586833 RepID=UPI001175DB9A|nr:dynein regulatory complex subunit 6 isoform X2 [Myripristis murdjan]
MDISKKHYERKCQRVALTRWLNWVKFRKTAQAAAIERLERVLDAVHLKRVVVAWRYAAMDSKRAKELFEKSDPGLSQMGSKEQHSGKRMDGLSVLPRKLSLKVFEYLQFRDWLRCADVCCTWRAIISSGSLWSQINFSVEKDWITDGTAKHILQSYCPFVIHLNMRGCTSLKWPSITSISECTNLQELNVSECLNITDTMLQRIVEGCPNLLYLNLSSTLVTNRTLRELSWNCVNLMYLSLAYCYSLTDEGFQCLTTGKGCHKLIHLNLSGCTQMTVVGFKYISAGCPLLKDIVINDMPTLSDTCILSCLVQQPLVAKCRSLSAVSLLNAPHLSDAVLEAVAATVRLKAFSTEGSNRITDTGWKALCRSSQGLRRLGAAECPRMTDESLKSVATLKNLQYLDISHCNKVCDTGLRYLTEGSSANNLRELNVSHCSRIRDISVMRIAQRLCKLRYLNLSYCEKLTDSALEWLSGSSISSLDVSGCNIQDQGLSALEGIRLKKVVLAECVCITDSGIEKLCKHVRDLEHVDVSHCVALSDQAIRALSFYCRGLVTLRMSECPKMTDVAVQYLTFGVQYLQELDVSGCVLLTDCTPQLLERSCPSLSSIQMTCCSGISRLAALRLQPRVQHWEHSRYDPPWWF